MEIIVKASPKEIAELGVALQARQANVETPTPKMTLNAACLSSAELGFLLAEREARFQRDSTLASKKTTQANEGVRERMDTAAEEPAIDSNDVRQVLKNSAYPELCTATTRVFKAERALVSAAARIECSQEGNTVIMECIREWVRRNLTVEAESWASKQGKMLMSINPDLS